MTEPVFNDHLQLDTEFSVSPGWSLQTGFTVYTMDVHPWLFEANIPNIYTGFLSGTQIYQIKVIVFPAKISISFKSSLPWATIKMEMCANDTVMKDSDKTLWLHYLFKLYRVPSDKKKTKNSIHSCEALQYECGMI